MFVNSGNKSFPFNSTTTLGLDLLNDVVSYSSTRSIVMNNAAQMDPGADLAKPILCYAGTAGMFTCQSPQPTSTIAFQELTTVTGGSNTKCGKLSTLLSTASTDLSAFMETYPIDISTCGL